MESLDTPSPKSQSARNWIGAILLVLVGIFVGRYIVPVDGGALKPLQFITVEEGERQLVFPTFWETWDVLHNQYIGDLDDQDLLYGAIRGMVRAAGDPYTAFSDPEEARQLEETLEGSFAGVGIEIGIRSRAVTVIAPLEGSPAQRAGIREGDIILAVDEDPVTTDATLDEVVRKIRGEQGKEVKLTVIHKEEDQPEEITIVRDTITIESVTTEFIGDIAHIELSSFNGDSTARFREAARAVRQQGATGIVLDVRSNPGGFLQTAVEIASLFLDPGTLVVSERGQENEEHVASGGALLKDVPLVVLMNEGSASAAEILAGALHDQLNVSLIGDKTFGKGSVQKLVKLDDGSSLRVTIAKWYTPSGRSIDDEGIEPTIAIEDDFETEEDEQLNRALEELGASI